MADDLYALRISPERCGKLMRVSDRFSMFLPGDAPCTLPKGHQPADVHTCVVRWGEESFWVRLDKETSGRL